jgi:hypothetical protein
MLQGSVRNGPGNTGAPGHLLPVDSGAEMQAGISTGENDDDQAL